MSLFYDILNRKLISLIDESKIASLRWKANVHFGIMNILFIPGNNKGWIATDVVIRQTPAVRGLFRLSLADQAEGEAADSAAGSALIARSRGKRMLFSMCICRNMSSSSSSSL